MIKKAWFAAIIILASLSISLHAQDERTDFLYFEASYDEQIPSAKSHEFIRADIKPSTYSAPAENSSSSLRKFSFGMLYEYQLPNKRFGISSGMRAAQINSKLRAGNYESTSDFYYVRLIVEPSHTDYVRVKEISQQSYYIGIPLEFKFFPWRMKKLRIYVKGGIQFDLLLSSKNQTLFYDDNMGKYQEDVNSLVAAPENYTIFTYGAAGIQLGRDRKPFGCIEFRLPSAYLSNNVSTLLDAEYGIGLALSIQLPLNITKP